MNAGYERDGFRVLPNFLPAADCDALQARAAELAAGVDALHLIDGRATYSEDNGLQRPGFPLRGFS